MATQFAKKLFKVGKRNLLALADAGQSHWTLMLAKCQINHRGYRKTSFCCQSHHGLRGSCRLKERPENLIT
jgi:hypothetical protein